MENRHIIGPSAQKSAQELDLCVLSTSRTAAKFSNGCILNFNLYRYYYFSENLFVSPEWVCMFK